MFCLTEYNYTRQIADEPRSSFMFTSYNDKTCDFSFSGIPTRSVTNFASAHDTEGTMTIDDFVDENGEEIELGNDSVW